MALFAIPLIPPVLKGLAIGLGAVGAAVAGFFGFRNAEAEQVPVKPQQPPKPAVNPAPSLLSKVAEVKQAVAERVEVASNKLEKAIEKVAGKVEQAQEFFTEATERISDDIRRIRKALTVHGMGLLLPWSGMKAQICDVQMLRKSFLKSPPLIRAPSQPLFTA